MFDLAIKLKVTQAIHIHSCPFKRHFVVKFVATQATIIIQSDPMESCFYRGLSWMWRLGAPEGGLQASKYAPPPHQLSRSFPSATSFEENRVTQISQTTRPGAVFPVEWGRERDSRSLCQILLTFFGKNRRKSNNFYRCLRVVENCQVFSVLCSWDIMDLDSAGIRWCQCNNIRFDPAWYMAFVHCASIKSNHLVIL